MQLTHRFGGSSNNCASVPVILNLGLATEVFLLEDLAGALSRHRRHMAIRLKSVAENECSQRSRTTDPRHPLSRHLPVTSEQTSLWHFCAAGTAQKANKKWSPAPMR